MPEIALTMKGVAMMKPLAMRTIMKKGTRAPMLGAAVGSPSSPRSAVETPVIVENTPAMMIGYNAKETTADSHLVK